jgi:hypothetical protein
VTAARDVHDEQQFSQRGSTSGGMQMDFSPVHSENELQKGMIIKVDRLKSFAQKERTHPELKRLTEYKWISVLDNQKRHAIQFSGAVCNHREKRNSSTDLDEKVASISNYLYAT